MPGELGLRPEPWPSCAGAAPSHRGTAAFVAMPTQTSQPWAPCQQLLGEGGSAPACWHGSRLLPPSSLAAILSWHSQRCSRMSDGVHAAPWAEQLGAEVPEVMRLLTEPIRSFLPQMHPHPPGLFQPYLRLRLLCCSHPVSALGVLTFMASPGSPSLPLYPMSH